MITRFACLRFLNDLRALSGKVNAANGRPEKAQSEFVKFADKGTARRDYNKFDAFSVQATHNLSPREEPFVNHGKPIRSNRFMNGNDKTSIAKFDFKMLFLFYSKSRNSPIIHNL